MIIRFLDLETSGETADHGVVELASLDLVDGAITERRDSLVNPEQPIPPEASAIHHLVDADVADKPTFAVMGPLLVCCPPTPTAFVAHNAKFERQWIDPIVGGIPWICSMKAAMRVWPQAEKFSNQYLRYWLHLQLGAEAQPTHRALPDCVVTAHIFMRLQQEASIEDMIAWTEEPPLWPRMPFGKHKGLEWSAVPEDYFQWVLRQPDMDEDTKWIVRREMDRRTKAARETYTVEAIAEAARLTSVEELENWFRKDLGNRISRSITPETEEFARIVAACAERKRTLTKTEAA